jgi:3-hydroxyacyl-[acyl-carrier-protein] dehydratase
MDEKWHSWSQKKDLPNGTVLAEACAESGSPWYSGHFPAEPVLPGIAILSMVMDVIRHHEAEKGSKVRMTGVKRVRFKLPVRPDELLKISVSLKQQATGLCYNFAVESDKKTVCTGIAEAKRLM